MLDGSAVLPNSVKSVLQLLSQGSSEPGRMTRGKVGRCARDMVSECRRCSKTVCRVSRVVSPQPPALHLQADNPLKKLAQVSNIQFFPYRTVQSNHPTRQPRKAASADSVAPATPPRSPTTSPTLQSSHTKTPPRAKEASAPLISPFIPAPATRRSGYACSAAKPSAPQTRPIVASGPGAPATAPISAAGWARASARARKV